MGSLAVPIFGRRTRIFSFAQSRSSNRRAQTSPMRTPYTARSRIIAGSRIWPGHPVLRVAIKRRTCSQRGLAAVRPTNKSLGSGLCPPILARTNRARPRSGRMRVATERRLDGRFLSAQCLALNVWLNKYQNFDQAKLSIARWIEKLQSRPSASRTPRTNPARRSCPVRPNPYFKHGPLCLVCRGALHPQLFLLFVIPSNKPGICCWLCIRGRL
jgi:hypothetical protein